MTNKELNKNKIDDGVGSVIEAMEAHFGVGGGQIQAPELKAETNTETVSVGATPTETQQVQQAEPTSEGKSANWEEKYARLNEHKSNLEKALHAERSERKRLGTAKDNEIAELQRHVAELANKGSETSEGIDEEVERLLVSKVAAVVAPLQQQLQEISFNERKNYFEKLDVEAAAQWGDKYKSAKQIFEEKVLNPESEFHSPELVRQCLSSDNPTTEIMRAVYGLNWRARNETQGSGGNGDRLNGGVDTKNKEQKIIPSLSSLAGGSPPPTKPPSEIDNLINNLKSVKGY